jgi:DNA repair protein RadC
MNAISNHIAEINVSYHPSQSLGPIITSSHEAYLEIFKWYPKETLCLKEYFLVMYLNRAHRVLGVYEVSSGGITGTVADTRLILGVALKSCACSIVVSHNHPSGNLKPSNSDIQLTNKLKEACKLMDICLLDHIIVSPSEGEYLSFADDGIL